MGTPIEKNAEFAGENRRTLALMSVEILPQKCMFRKRWFSTKNINFPRNCWSGLSENLHAGPQHSFGKLSFEQRWSFKNTFFQETKKLFPVTPPSIKSNSQQAEV